MVSEKVKANLRPCTPENARERQAKSVAKRKENRTLREIMEAVTGEKGRKEAIIRAVVERAERGDLAAFDRVRDVLKEQGDSSILNALNLCVSPETADILKGVSNGEPDKQSI